MYKTFGIRILRDSGEKGPPIEFREILKINYMK